LPGEVARRVASSAAAAVRRAGGSMSGRTVAKVVASASGSMADTDTLRLMIHRSTMVCSVVKPGKGCVEMGSRLLRRNGGPATLGSDRAYRRLGTRLTPRWSGLVGGALVEGTSELFMRTL
jgi:hypothetical protein